MKALFYFIVYCLFTMLGIVTIALGIMLYYNCIINEIIWVSAGTLYLSIGYKLFGKSQKLIYEERRSRK